MKRFPFAALAALTLAASQGVGTAHAQLFQPGPQMPVNPYQRPTVSPYLNMTRPGNSAVNYFALVRPQLNTANSILQLQQQQQGLPMMGSAFSTPLSNGGSLGGMPETGHPTAFMNYSSYFPNSTGQRTGSAPSIGSMQKR